MRAAAPGRAVLARREGWRLSIAIVSDGDVAQTISSCVPPGVGRLKSLYFSRLEICVGCVNAPAAHCMRAALIVCARRDRACYGRWMVAAARVKLRRPRLGPNKGCATSATARARSRLSRTTRSAGGPTATPEWGAVTRRPRRRRLIVETALGWAARPDRRARAL